MKTLSFTLCLLILSACSEHPATDDPALAPPLTFEQGFDDSSAFISSFEATFGFPFGGDGSIITWIDHFNIPLRWVHWSLTPTGWSASIGDPISEYQILSFRPATILFKSTFDYDLFTPYLYGVISAL